MKTCLFCRNTRIFNIHNDYGNYNHTIKDDMLQFFGYQIEEHLRPDDAVCNLCMNIMDNVAKLKRRLLPLIFRTDTSYMEDCKPINFGKKWDVFASMNFDEESDQFLGSQSPTPSNLLKCKRVVPYESPVEIKIAEIERHRSLGNISVAKSDADSEIVRAFSKKRGKRRKRGHNWSRRKNGRYSRPKTDLETSQSVVSNYTTRSYTRTRPKSVMSIMSTESYESFYPPVVEVTSPVAVIPEKKIGYVDMWCLENNITSSVTEEEQDELYECGEGSCEYICDDIDVMSQHKVTKHGQLALFWCNYCGKKYTSNSDLRVHKRTHSEQFSCVICHKEFYVEEHLLQHWQEHVKKSVPCKYCGKKFVDRKVCNRHIKNVHKRNIPSRIDYEEKQIKQSNSKSTDFEVRFLVQDVNTVLED